MDFITDPHILARLQFAFVVSFHILFPSFTIGLASWLAVVEGLWLKTGRTVYKEVYQHWVKIFAVMFGMGVVTGVVMSYQFGTNWAPFADAVANVIGPLLGFEVLTAFFLEASFLGIMLFGWGRVSRRMHFASTCIVAVGTLVSAFWILDANSWMQTPVAYRVDELGLLHATNWLRVIFNPSFPYRFTHMVLAAYLTTAFAVGGVGAFYLLRHRHPAHGKVMLAMAMLMACFVAPLQLVVGDLHGLNTLHHQPTKVAAMEGLWNTESGANLQLLATVDESTRTTTSYLSVPHGASLILTHSLNGEIKGLNDFGDNIPPVNIVFWSFRVMVGLGTLMILTGLSAAFLYWRKKLFTATWFHRWCVAMAPAGFVAVLAGWFVTEVGRQPYTVYGVLKTASGVSPVPGHAMLASLLIFIALYALLFISAVFYVGRLIVRGPLKADKSHQHAHPGMSGRLSPEGEDANV
ncbi:MAG: cytochrome ubiquinol oxidase subunit I [Proteobacteria bacterium]|nr:cytochrome ubiquinol oxidase subunit I [Pseudomonadota bacterium]